MLKTIFYNPQYLLLSLLVHAAVAVLLVVSFQWNYKAKEEPRKNIVEAVVVDQAKVKAEIEKLKKAEEAKKAREQRRLKELDKKIRTARLKRKAEEKRLAAAKIKSQQEAKKLAAAKKKEAERVAKLKKQQQENGNS